MRHIPLRHCIPPMQTTQFVNGSNNGSQTVQVTALKSVVSRVDTCQFWAQKVIDSLVLI